MRRESRSECPSAFARRDPVAHELLELLDVWEPTLCGFHKALELLAKHFSLLADRVKLETDEKLLALLDEGRRRNAQRDRE